MLLGYIKNMEINLILLVPDAMIIGWQYHKPEKGFDFSELNLYLFFGQLQIRWAKDEYI